MNKLFYISKSVLRTERKDTQREIDLGFTQIFFIAHLEIGSNRLSKILGPVYTWRTLTGVKLNNN